MPGLATMGNLSKAHFFDAGQNPPRTRVVTIAGVRYIEKMPNGMTERWVNGAGSVVWQQIIPPGQPKTSEALAARRSEILRRRGRWVQVSSCPLQPGSPSALTLADFPPDLQRPCTNHDGKACPHVRHIIIERRELAAIKRQSRHALMRRRETERLAKEEAQQRNQRELSESLRTIAERVSAMPPAPAPTVVDDAPTNDAPSKPSKTPKPAKE